MKKSYCIECKFCVFIEQRADGSETPFCDSATTKEQFFWEPLGYQAPIGALTVISEACSLFEQAEERQHTLVASL